MNFLGIEQVSVIIFTLKIIFEMNYPIFSLLWTAHAIKPKARGLSAKIPKTRNSMPWTAG
jgi:hypothetical protein